MRSRGIGSVSALLALSWLAPAAQAQDGLARTAVGTIVRIETTRLDVKDATGATVSFVLLAKTQFRRGETRVQLADIKSGERVSVMFEQGASAKTALTVRVGTPEEKTVYACPMHPEVVSEKPGKCHKCGMNLVQRPKRP